MILRKQRPAGQAIALFAIILPLAAFFSMVVLDYLVTTTRIMMAVAAADLAAHAGAQEVVTYPDGTLKIDAVNGPTIVAAYWELQQPAHTTAVDIQCGQEENRPMCSITVEVESGGYLLPKRTVTVRAVGYFAHGVTRDQQ